MSEATDDLIAKAQKQLDEHKEWLSTQICGLPLDVLDVGSAIMLASKATQIRLRVAKVSGRVVSVVYEYPDELVAFLRAETTPKHLRDSLAGGHVVDPSQQTFTATREG